jgi:site-specific DNA-cytosine methylase
MSNIKWGIIQPLSGGMYWGARNATGCPAAWILSYPGLTSVKRNKDGEMTSVGNEYGLLKWCKDHNELPPYQLFNKSPFDKTDFDVDIVDDPVWSTEKVDYSNTDLVVSVPVCSGLSQATIASQDTKDERNCNMLWNAEFALSKIKPKIYIFENAPTLFSNTGSHVRDMLNDLAKKYDYSIVYYKTDTRLHDNCQRRPRTFVLFVKHRDGEGTPDFQFENKQVSIEEFFSRLPADATQQVTVEMNETNKLFLDYIRNKYGTNYRDSVDPWILKKIIDNDLYEDVCDFAQKSDYAQKTKDSLSHLMRHIHDKIAAGKNYYCMLPGYPKADGTVPAVMFKTIPSLLHHKEDRLYTIREYLHLMGMPNDYELPGSINSNYAKIGQNVPARTAQWIVSEALRIIESWDTIERHNNDILFVDNTKQTIR